MTADDDAESPHRTPKQRTLGLADIDLDGFLVASQEAVSLPALTHAFLERVRRAGFTRANYVQVISNFERLPLTVGTRLLDGQADPPVTPPRLTYFDPDPAMSRKLVQLEPYTWVAITQEFTLNTEIMDRVAEYRSAGYVDGVTIPVSLREGDIAAFTFVQPMVIFSIADAVFKKLQYLCQTMHARYAALDPGKAVGKLSARETQVMMLLAVGKTNASIASELNISVHTVNTLVRRCFTKLGVSNRVEAAARMAYLMGRK